VRTLTAVMALAVVVAACGDDDDDDNVGQATTAAPATSASAATTAAATTAAGTTAAGTSAASMTSGASTTGGGASSAAAAKPTKSEIKLGLAAGVTGVAGPTQKVAPGVVQAWQEWVNETQGGINGHPVNVVVKDTRSDAATGQTVVKDLVENDKVLGVILVDSSSEGAVGPYLAQQNVPVTGGAGYNQDVWSKLPNVFGVTTTIPAVVQEQVVGAVAVGAKAFAVATCAEIAACAQADPLYKGTAEALGMTYAGLIQVSSTAPSYTAECLQFIDKKADFIQLSLTGEGGKRIINDCTKQGYKGFFGASAGTVSTATFEDVEGLRLAGGLHAFPWYADEAPVQQYNDVMKEYDPSGDHRDPTSTAVWSSLELFRKAMANASDNPTRDEVFQAYWQVKNETLDGLLPEPITYTQGQPQAKINCFFPFKLENGEFSASTAPGGSGNGETGGLKSACFPPKA